MKSWNSNCRTKKPIFIGGDGRSGTTLLSIILDSHPMLSVGPELHFNGPKNLAKYVLECFYLLINQDSRAFGKGLKENSQFKLGVQFAKRCHRFGLEFTDLRNLTVEYIQNTGSKLENFQERCGLIDAIGESILVKTGKQRWGIKIMREIKKLQDYSKIWPSAQFIHIVRDGRDVAASQMIEHGSWGYNDIKVAAKGWADLVVKTRCIAKKGYSFYEVRYEDIVLDTKNELSKLVDFLDVPWDDQLLKHNQMDHSLFNNPYNHASFITVTKPINASSIGRYKADLTKDQIDAFESIAGETLKSLGYYRES